jgi:hypothetical protein
MGRRASSLLSDRKGRLRVFFFFMNPGGQIIWVVAISLSANTHVLAMQRGRGPNPAHKARACMNCILQLIRFRGRLTRRAGIDSSVQPTTLAAAPLVGPRQCESLQLMSMAEMLDWRSNSFRCTCQTDSRVPRVRPLGNWTVENMQVDRGRVPLPNILTVPHGQLGNRMQRSSPTAEARIAAESFFTS